MRAARTASAVSRMTSAQDPKMERVTSLLTTALAQYGTTVAARFATGGGEPEELLRGPFETLVATLAKHLSLPGEPVLTGEHHLAEERIRPDYAVYIDGLAVGFVELKAPGKGVVPTRFRGHDRRQWERLACLPNVLYSDGQSFAVYRFGERVGEVVMLVGEITSAGGSLSASDDRLPALLEDFLQWQPLAPRRPRELARTVARLCRVLRAEVHESLDAEVVGLRDLAADWRRLLYPDASDDEFADGYAQTVTFALLLARVEGIELSGRDLRLVADELGSRHTVMARALSLLTDPSVLPKLAVSVDTLQRILGVVDWPTLSKSDPSAWLFFYEEFLEHYDPELRKQTGSYYTPVEAVDPVVRMVDDLLRSRLGHPMGLAAPEVTVVDPAAGTGSFLFRVIDRIATSVEDDLGPGAVGPALRQAARRLIGFELQAGPFSVAELRLATEFSRLGAHLGKDELRLHLTNTLGDPFVEQQQMPATYRPLAESRQRANAIKRSEPVLVVLGNPPYRVASRGEGEWIESGSKGQPAPLQAFVPPKALGLGAHVKHLYNPYVYFWRWATWKVFEHHPADRGVVAFVTVQGFVAGPGFAEMRRYLRRTADAVWVIDCSPEGHQPAVPTRIFQGVQQPVCIMIAVRDGTTGEKPAPVSYTSVSGLRGEKFAQLAALELGGDAWRRCPDAWHAPFLPEGEAAWAAMPALDHLLAWSGSGTMPGRTWVVGPSPGVLKERFARLSSAPTDEQPTLFAEHPQDRRVDTVLGDDLPGYRARGALAADPGPARQPERYGLRSFDRAWILPDKRLVNRPNPGLWQIRTAPGQLFLTAPDRTSPSGGPALTATALVPDLHHYHGRGGRAFPLYLDAAGQRPNVPAGLLASLSTRLGRDVGGEDVAAYVAALLAHPSYTARFQADLLTPGLRVPVTADGAVFADAVALGRRVLFLHTYGARFAELEANRPSEPPRVVHGGRPLVVTPIPDDAEHMPAEIEHDAATHRLHVGAGVVEGVTDAMWAYEVSGYRVVKRWFDRRKRDPDGRRSSSLDDRTPASWEPEWTRELIDLLNVIALLVELEPQQADLLERVLAGPLISAQDLLDHGVMPSAALEARDRPAPERPVRQGQL
jgi:hypothetical protein